MPAKTARFGNPFVRAEWRGCAPLASIIGTAWAMQLVASPALFSSGTPAPTTHVVPLSSGGHDDSGKEGLQGATGDPGEGPGNWRLIVDSGETEKAMSLQESSTGQSPNPSTEPPRDPAVVEDHWVETSRGNPAGVVVAVVDAEGFDPGLHGQRITDTFLDRTRHASLVQIGGWGTYELNGLLVDGTNRSGYIRHALTRGGGILWTATDDSPLYYPNRPGWFVENGRPFPELMPEFANWMQYQDVLFISSLENASCAGPQRGCVALYCDDFELDANGEWIPLCGAVDDYVAHSGVGLDTVLFVGALELEGRFASGTIRASGAIRADGVFAPHTIYVESPDGSTSHATPVLAAYATNLATANPSWSAARLKRELMALARQETVEYVTGGIDELGTDVTEPRTVKAIRPPGPVVVNGAPAALGTLPPRTLAPRATQVVDVSRAFGDPDGDTLTYAVSSSAPSVVTARVAGAGVVLNAIREGNSTIQVTATDPGGLSATQSFAVTVTRRFTDDPIRPGVTPIRAVHFTELRARIDRVRQAAGLPSYAWTDPVLTPGVTLVRLAHLLDLRTALDQAYAASGRSAPRWSNATPAAATVIRAVHLTELRGAVVALE